MSSELKPEERMTVEEYKANFLDAKKEHLLIDVRPRVMADFSKLSNAINIPLEEMEKGNGIDLLEDLIDKQLNRNQSTVNVIMMCRRGVTSEKAVIFLKTKIKNKNILIKDIIGGLEKWSKDIDPTLQLN